MANRFWVVLTQVTHHPRWWVAPQKKGKQLSSYNRSREDLLRDLEDQRRALSASAKGYDAGDAWEAPRLATAIYTIVNDGRGRSKTISILTRLEMLEKIKFFSSVAKRAPGVISLGEFGTPLCTLETTISDNVVSTKYAPNLAVPWRVSGLLPFSEWWEESVYQNSRSETLSRKDVISYLRDKEGGSHLDGEIPMSPYLDLRKLQSATIGAEDESGNPVEMKIKHLPNAHLASGRQIAWELEVSLKGFFGSI